MLILRLILTTFLLVDYTGALFVSGRIADDFAQIVDLIRDTFVREYRGHALMYGRRRSRDRTDVDRL